MLRCVIVATEQKREADPLDEWGDREYPVAEDMAFQRATWVAERIGWDKPAPAGQFRGVAQMKAFNSYVAAACEISARLWPTRSASILAS